jgi:hypothetical protein
VVVVTVGRHDLQVIEFPDAADANSYGVSVGGVGVDEPRPYEWRSGRIVVFFPGGDRSFTDSITEILGAPNVAPLLAP